MERSEEIIDMEKGPDGSYRASNRIIKRRFPQRIYPQGQQGITRPGGSLGRLYEFLGGFIIGLDAIDEVFEVIKRRFGGPMR